MYNAVHKELWSSPAEYWAKQRKPFAEFLKLGGNAALLDAPLIQVTGLLGQDPTNPEATASIFAILRGSGGF